jgi:2-(1,2-epoxy-1,2-dihydrophenyl)acetyl-CoA isomerase
MDIEATHHIRTGLTDDHREAAKAFVDRRDPHFTGH